MHMADALVAPAVAGTMYAASAAAAGYSIKKVRMEDDPKKIPMMGVMGAFVFAAQMINFTIPGTGSSGHLCGGMLLAAVLGPCAGFLTLIGVLLIQCLFFADGGLLALGCNVWNMAFYGCFLGTLLIWKPMMRGGMSRKKILIASILGCVLTLQLGAFSVTLETLLSGVTALPFAAFAAAMQPIHLAIGFVEGLITAAVLLFVYDARPELLYAAATQKEGRLSFKNTISILAISALLIGGGLSLLASSHPDGLEWSIERLTGSTELSASGSLYETAGSIQETTSLLADYTVNGSEAPAGTIVSGLVGSVLVCAACVAVCQGLKLFRRKHENGPDKQCSA